MKNSIYRITLDMHDVASQVQITAKQHDTARKLHITLMENGKPYSIEEGCRAVLSINRPGSTVINDNCEIKMNGSVIMYDFKSPTTEVLGINECEVKLYNHDGDIITSPRFTLLVDENVYNDGEYHGLDHSKILNRDKEDQHPIKAITGLEAELSSKANNDTVNKLSGKVDQIANNQIPEVYLKAAVDAYVEQHSAGFTTKAETAELKSDLDGLYDGYNIEVSQSVKAYNTYMYDCVLRKGIKYTFTNLTGSNMSLNLYDSEGTNIQTIKKSLLENDSISFVPTQTAHKIGGYVNASLFAFRLINDGISDDIAAIPNINGELQNLKNVLYGGELSVNQSVIAYNTYKYSYVLKKGVKYTFTNLSGNAMNLSLYDAGGNEIQRIRDALQNNASETFIPEQTAYMIGGYVNTSTFAFTLVSFGVANTTRYGMHVNIGNNAIPEFEYANSKLTITIPRNTTLTYIGADNPTGYIGYKANEILEMLDSSKFAYDENSMVFTIDGDIGLLYYDTSNHMFGIENSVRIDDNWLVLVMNWYGNIHGDWVYKTAYEAVTRVVKPEISGLQTEVTGSPYYEKFQKYCKLMYGDLLVPEYVAPTNFENFLWFTDPHTMYGDYGNSIDDRTNGCAYYDKYIAQLKFAYNSTPTDFVLCGGDWNDGGLPENELFKLSRAVERCKAELSPFYNCVGNHDTNYQGQKDGDSESRTSKFSSLCLKNLWYREYDHCYHTFIGRKTKFYVLDSRLENQSLAAENDYLLEESKWFAESLLTDNSPHIAIALHIYYYTGTTISPFANQILEIACAYNARVSIDVDGVTYDYSTAIGKVEFVMAGHSHTDYITSHYSYNVSIPIIATINAGNLTGAGESYFGAQHCIFDLVNVDYDNRIINMIRIGELGTDRTAQLT